MSGLLQFVHTSVLRVSICSTFRAIGNFGTVPLNVTRQIAVKAKALIWLSGLLLTCVSLVYHLQILAHVADLLL